jgi:hypothetical protein
MYEIIIPLPPHFNYGYAGWSPSRFWVLANSGPLNLPLPPTRIVSFHHSNADIKKISGYGQLLWTETPIATSCYTITQIIDIAFGWLWGHSVSTQVICNYVDNPFITIPFGQIIGTGRPRLFRRKYIQRRQQNFRHLYYYPEYMRFGYKYVWQAVWELFATKHQKRFQSE